MLNHFLIIINGIKTNSIYYMSTDCLCNEKKHLVKLNEVNYVGEDLVQENNDYGVGGIFMLCL